MGYLPYKIANLFLVAKYCVVEGVRTLSIENTRVALGCTLPPVWLVPTGVHLIKFIIGNLSYSPCSKPSRTVLLLDVMCTMYACHLS